MKLAQGYRRYCRFKIFLFLKSGHLVYRSRTVFSILIEDNLNNIVVKFQSVEIAFEANYSRFTIFLALTAILFIGTEPF